MASSQRIETVGQRALEGQALAPACPDCGGTMVVRPMRHGDEVNGLMWRCRRELICAGSRRIRDPLVIQPMADASTYAIFEWERSLDRRGWNGPSSPAVSAPPARGGRLGGLFGRGRSSDSGSGGVAQPVHRTPSHAYADSPLAPLIEYGYVVLDDRVVSSAHARVDQLVIGPTGVYVVDRKEWLGQISAGSDQVYVDGRQRTGATDDVLRAVAAVDAVLAHEFKPLGVAAHPVIAFDGASNTRFEARLGKIDLAGGRSVAKLLRSGEAALGPETVVRLALAADRLLD